MRFSESEISGVFVIEPDVHRDARGFFLETYHARKYAAHGLDVAFVQDNQSSSVKDTLRGLHMQRRNPQGKLVRAVKGSIWDVAVDLRPASPTFRRWTGVELTADNFRQLYVPAGCAHGFCVTSEHADVEYKCTALYDPADEIGIAYDDPELAIRWPVAHPILSHRDRHHPPLAVALEALGVELAADLRLIPS
jgi:dTDP-4-dehydrorhamnose 3,5-epimerase